MNPEDFFKLGAEAMRTEIATRLMMRGELKIAPLILKMELPRFQVPEKFSIEEEKKLG